MPLSVVFRLPWLISKNCIFKFFKGLVKKVYQRSVIKVFFKNRIVKTLETLKRDFGAALKTMKIPKYPNDHERGGQGLELKVISENILS